MREYNKVQFFREITNQMSDLYEQKNTAYGDSFGRSVEKYGLISALTRISDKFNRLENLILHPDVDQDDERVIDTLKDLASYCIMTYIEIIIEEDKSNYSTVENRTLEDKD